MSFLRIHKIRETALFALVILLGTLVLGGIAFGWTAPTQSPPNGNVAAPLNTGSGSQTKSGNLTVSGTFGAQNGNVSGTFNVVSTTTLSARLGIGTTAPSRLLHVEEAHGGATYPHVLIREPGTSNNRGAKLGLDASSSTGGGFWHISSMGSDYEGNPAAVAGALSFYDATTDRHMMYVTKATGSVIVNYGNLGIGTTNPLDRLSMGDPVSASTPSYGNSTYLRLPVYGNAPPASDCDSSQEIGRMAVVYDQNTVLYLCSKYTGQATGWVSVK